MLVDRDVAIAGGVSDTRNPALMRMMSFIGATDRAGSGIEMIWSVWGKFYSALPMISESHGPSETLLVLPIELHQDIASDSPEGEQRIRHGENDVLRCFESIGTELGVGDVMAMLPGISKRTAQKRLKALFEKGEVARRKEGALSCTSRSSFRSGVPFANRSRPTAPVRESFAPGTADVFLYILHRPA